MKNVDASLLIENLQTALREMDERVKQEFGGMESDLLNQRPSPKSWSMLECIKHITLANTPYKVEIQDQLAKATGSQKQVSDSYMASWKGRLFTKMMEPKSDGRIKNKMGTMKIFKPENEGQGGQ